MAVLWVTAMFLILAVQQSLQDPTVRVITRLQMMLELCPPIDGRSYSIINNTNCEQYYICENRRFLRFIMCSFTNSTFSLDTLKCERNIECFNKEDEYEQPADYLKSLLSTVLSSLNINVTHSHPVPVEETSNIATPPRGTKDKNRQYRNVNNSNEIDSKHAQSTEEIVNSPEQTIRKLKLMLTESSQNSTGLGSEPYSFKTVDSNMSTIEQSLRFWDYFVLPIVKNLVNDPEVMPKLSSVFRTVFEAAVPLATKVVEESERTDVPLTDVTISKSDLAGAIEKVNTEALPVLKEVLKQKLPLIFRSIGDNIMAFVDVMSEIYRRLQSEAPDLIRLLVKYGLEVNKSNEKFTIAEIQSDFEPYIKIVSDVLKEYIQKQPDNISNVSFISV